MAWFDAVVWLAVAWLLWDLDRRVRRLEGDTEDLYATKLDVEP